MINKFKSINNRIEYLYEIYALYNLIYDYICKIEKEYDNDNFANYSEEYIRTRRVRYDIHSSLIDINNLLCLTNKELEYTINELESFSDKIDNKIAEDEKNEC